MDDMQAKGFKNDSMSSLIVAEGWAVDLFQHHNFTGEKCTVTAADGECRVPWIVDRGHPNDCLTSFRVYPASDAEQPAISLFADKDFGGNRVDFPAGTVRFRM